MIKTKNRITRQCKLKEYNKTAKAKEKFKSIKTTLVDVKAVLVENNSWSGPQKSATKFAFYLLSKGIFKVYWRVSKTVVAVV